MDKEDRISQRMMDMARRYAALLQEILGESLVSVVLFGSVARGQAIAGSDIDLLIVIRSLPPGRFARKACLSGVDERFDGEMRRLEEREGIECRLSRILKTPEEASRTVPLYLDMVEDAVILYDRDGFFVRILDRLREHLAELGAKRIRSGEIFYWDLKPDLKRGEIFSI